MSLFERLSRVARAEINYAKSQPELLYRARMEARLQELDNLVGNNELSKFIRLLEEINADVAAMKAQLSGRVISR
jgi:hypothetical protein